MLERESLSDFQRGPAAEAGPRCGGVVAAEVFVSTATALLFSSRDPWLVLVADSAKHRLPVLPGGKIERGDLLDSPEESARKALLREVREETGLSQPVELRLLAIAVDPDRDIREVDFGVLQDAIYRGDETGALLALDRVRAHYGAPDYVFCGAVREDQVQASDELKNPRFVDVRAIRPEEFSAGHGCLLLWWRIMLENGLRSFPPGALQDFQSDLRRFSFLSGQPAQEANREQSSDKADL